MYTYPFMPAGLGPRLIWREKPMCSDPIYEMTQCFLLTSAFEESLAGMLSNAL